MRKAVKWWLSSKKGSPGNAWSLERFHPSSHDSQVTGCLPILPSRTVQIWRHIEHLGGGAASQAGGFGRRPATCLTASPSPDSIRDDLTANKEMLMWPVLQRANLWSSGLDSSFKEMGFKGFEATKGGSAQECVPYEASQIVSAENTFTSLGPNLNPRMHEPALTKSSKPPNDNQSRAVKLLRRALAHSRPQDHQLSLLLQRPLRSVHLQQPQHLAHPPPSVHLPLVPLHPGQHLHSVHPNPCFGQSDFGRVGFGGGSMTTAAPATTAPTSAFGQPAFAQSAFGTSAPPSSLPLALGHTLVEGQLSAFAAAAATKPAGGSVFGPSAFGQAHTATAPASNAFGGSAFGASAQIQRGFLAFSNPQGTTTTPSAFGQPAQTTATTAFDQPSQPTSAFSGGDAFGQPASSQPLVLALSQPQ
ncbi:hypothetical protein BKA70DRAFT_1218634 [Coprinopsis sp. MPI-PUGE-AT-0042]|nr:hypothetical protein BKA70DRAFT_1218634 [Coprinopsis sp. MPI-PUGE-AT-0042]